MGEDVPEGLQRLTAKRRAARGMGLTRAGLLVGVLCLVAGACTSPVPEPRHLLLISVDTLRADHLGCYGHPLELTPHIDALAAESTRFTSTYAATPFTLPSVVAILTGRHPQGLGMLSNFGSLPTGVPTLAEILRKRGWTTGAVVSNYVVRRSSGLNRGFAKYNAIFPQAELNRPNLRERIAADTTDAALALLPKLLGNGQGPVFLWVHFQDPHGPYTPPPGWPERYLKHERMAPDGRRALGLDKDHRGVGGIPEYQVLGDQREVAYYRASYDAEIRYMDQEVGRPSQESPRRSRGRRRR